MGSEVFVKTIKIQPLLFADDTELQKALEQDPSKQRPVSFCHLIILNFK